MNNKFEKCLIDSVEELESEGIQNTKEIALEILEKKLYNISKSPKPIKTPKTWNLLLFPTQNSRKKV